MARRGRSRILVGFAVAMFLGVAVYFRLWAIQHSLASDDAELIRRQFDLANKEAMDESAEWRFRFDKEAERASKCAKELEEIKESLEKKEDSTSSESSDKRLKMLQKENAALLKQMETLKNELEAEKRRCRS
ncbi:hypothetical protein V6N13_006196 [Hibiscus sabdariffa]|uniref:Uncharacterized protein n=1 Tax=Hibiscus sabdariffa TaxID=183260 RepID=A0ABR2ENL9_9ROSI